MKKIFTLMTVAMMAFTASSQEKEWNISDFEEAVFKEATTIDGLTIYATESGSVTIDANNKTVDGVKYTKRLKTGGAGSVTDGVYGRIISFDVPSNGTITLIATSSNNDDSRVLGVSFGEFIAFPAEGDTPAGLNALTVEPGNPQIQTVEYDGKEATKVYIYSKSGGINFYDFKFTPAAVEGDEELMSWDFTKWSEATVANLKAGANWSNDEKDNGTITEGCFWQVSCTAGLSPEKYLMANDVVISELEGLVYTNTTKDRSLAIAVDYPETSLGTYHGPAYLWLGASKINYFIIPGVPAGATIKMGVESHKSTDARGVVLSIGEQTLTAPNGEEVAAPTTYTEQEWLVPADAAESNDVHITNTNGCHIYFITVTAGESGSGVANVEAEGAVEYYNLQGVRVANPENGIFIKRQGNKATKVLVK